MPPRDPDPQDIPDDEPLRPHLITMLDQVIWLSQWSTTVTSLTIADRQELEQHLAELDAALQTALTQQSPPEAY